jgi:uncharacterized membrane protein SirB2
MAHLLIVYVHLIATCMAVGVIVMTDMRLLAKLVGYRVVIPPPQRFETLMIIVATTLLLCSGLLLVMTGLAGDRNYLNPKLQAKILLVALLVANAFALHYVTFPRLARGRRVASWRLRDHLSVALPVGLSNSLWMYVAFLGIARSWNSTMGFGQVLAIAVVLFVISSIAVLVALRFGARDEPQQRADWIDAMKARLSDRKPPRERRRHERPRFEDTLM